VVAGGQGSAREDAPSPTGSPDREELGAALRDLSDRLRTLEAARLQTSDTAGPQTSDTAEPPTSDVAGAQTSQAAEPRTSVAAEPPPADQAATASWSWLGPGRAVLVVALLGVVAYMVLGSGPTVTFPTPTPRPASTVAPTPTRFSTAAPAVARSAIPTATVRSTGSPSPAPRPEEPRGTAVAVASADDKLLAVSASSTSGPGPSPSGVLPPTVIASAAPAARVEERFRDNRRGWPNDARGNAWLAEGGYRLFAREPGRFVALRAPGAGTFRNVFLSATFRKVGGPEGGGYGLIVRDQSAEPLNGAVQTGRFYVLGVGDKGQIGVWRREGDKWIDVLPWSADDAVRRGREENTVEAWAIGPNLTLTVNGIDAATVQDSTLTEGHVGVFVGGDGNEALLVSFTVRPLD
jgi:hypothetical protein